MLEIIFAYLLFLAKFATIFFGVIFLLTFRMNAKKKKKFVIENISEKFKKNAQELAGDANIDLSIDLNGKNPQNVFLLDFNGGIKADEVESLSEKIDTILVIADKRDQVVVRLDSPGGTINGYGLGAAQLQRLKAAKIPLTVCVDRVAASGGYMMACVADKLIAAPFAYVGSIGVVAEFPNFSNLLEKIGIDFKTYTAGEYKRTVSPYQKPTETDEKKLNEDLQKTHKLFKDHVIQYRKNVDIDNVATGEVWCALETVQKNLNLVDEIKTSNEYIFKLFASGANILLIKEPEPKKTIREKLQAATAKLLNLHI